MDLEPCEKSRLETDPPDSFILLDEIPEEAESLDPTKAEYQRKNGGAEETCLANVFETIDCLKSPGSTCTGGFAAKLPAMPGLVVDRVGEVPLPVDEETVTKIITAASQAPHERGMETEIDSSMRSTVQIDAGMVALTNPAWHCALEELTKRVCLDLGVNSQFVRAQLDKLLLHEQGGCFKKRRDTEKTKGLFATLMIQLPSSFTGGSFVVSRNGQTQTFCLQEAETSPYMCRYLAYHTDCEHEMLPIESGYRLILSYSLCYTGNGVSKSSSGQIEEGLLESVIHQLNKRDSLFAVPLNHRYTSSSLRSLGVGTLKGTDQALALTVGQQVDGWELIVATADRKVEELGSSNPYSGEFDDHDATPGDVCLKELFHQDGSDANVNKEWLDRELNFDPIQKGGMLLATYNVCKDMWGNEKEGFLHNAEHEGESDETTYSTCFLIAFNTESTFESVCRSNFSNAVKFVQRNPELLDYAIKYMTRSKSRIGWDDFLALFKLIQGKSTFWPWFETIVKALPQAKFPSNQVILVFVNMIMKHGWHDARIAAIREFVLQLPDIGKEADCKEFLEMMWVIFKLTKNAFMKSLWQKTLSNFHRATEHNWPSWCFHQDNCGYAPGMSQAVSIDICKHLVAFSKRYRSEKVTTLVELCFVRIRKMSSMVKLVETLPYQMRAIEMISRNVPSMNIGSLRLSLLNDLVRVLVESKASSVMDSLRRTDVGNSVWESSNIEFALTLLIRYGTPSMFRSIETWAVTAPACILSKAHSVMQKLRPRNIKSDHAEAKDKCLDMVHIWYREVQICQLVYEEQILILNTQGGKPVFSWSMPDADTSHKNLDKFLRSDLRGPAEVRVGGGIPTALRLASRVRARRSAGHPASTQQILAQGFSVEIQLSEKYDEEASVIVTKTKELYNAKVEEYNSNMKELSNVRAEIEKLHHSSSQPEQGHPSNQPEQGHPSRRPKQEEPAAKRLKVADGDET